MTKVLVPGVWLLCLWSSVVLAADVTPLSAYPEGEMIRVAAGEMLVIDTAGLVWTGPPPELIVLQVYSDDYATPYRADRTRYTLNVATLAPQDAPPFKGLEAGAAAYLLLGREPEMGGLAKGMFLPDRVWYLDVAPEGAP